LGRQLYTARLTRRLLLSERAACFHLEFTVDELEKFDFQPGQFVSFVAHDPAGKQQTRAYSIASAPRANQFDVCVNRVEGGFFSNLLCDLEVGQSLQFHGPHGLFLLRAPLTDSIFIATGTGIAPMRGFVEHLFPEDGEDRSQGRKIWLVYGTRHESELYYEDYFEKDRCQPAKFLLPQDAEPAPRGWEGSAGTCRNWWDRSLAEHARDSARIRARRRAGVQHPRLYLRIERNGFRQPGLPERLGLGAKTDHLRTLRLICWAR
jgi:ferredoxin-NADP reductase